MSQFDLAQRAKVFKALSDPTRLQIVEFLADGQERTGKDIADKIIEHLERQVRPLSSDRENVTRSNRRINVN